MVSINDSYSKIIIYLHSYKVSNIYTVNIGLMSRVFANGPGD